MGKALVWLGNKIIAFYTAMKCQWNKLMMMMMFKLEDCPNEVCVCKKKL